ncbi:hypothetical protein ACWD00_11895 [Streptomyces viridiviolaceus]
MRKYQKAAVVLAMLGSAGFLGTGVSYAGGDPSVDITNTQTNSCGNESQSGLVNIDRLQANVIAIPVASPQDFSHTSVCNNGFGG